MTNLRQILKNGGLSIEIIEQFIDLATVENVKTRRAILEYNEKCDKIYFVLNGGFTCKYRNSETEVEKTVNFFLKTFQPFMTVVESYFNNTPTSCRLQAITNSDVLVFKKKELDEFSDKNPLFKEFYYREFIKALIAENNFRLKLITYTPENFYKHLISDYPEILKNVTSRDIADFIGVSPVWLTNLKTKKKLNS
jgi:CRP-like cAMP-binding protein